MGIDMTDPKRLMSLADEYDYDRYTQGKLCGANVAIFIQIICAPGSNIAFKSFSCITD